MAESQGTDNFLDDIEKSETPEEEMTPFEYWFYRTIEASLRTYFVPSGTEFLQQRNMSKEQISALMLMMLESADINNEAVLVTWV